MLLPMYMFLAVVSIALFSFVSVAAWSAQRRKEREAYYKSETLRKIAETQGAGSTAALEFLREDERNAAQQRREGQRLGGLITIAVGVAMMIFLRNLPDPDARQSFLVGLIPFLIGVVLLANSLLTTPRQ
jgi:hypothetical protein